MTMTKCWMLLTSWLFIIGYIPESQQLVIKKINVPATVKLGEIDHVIFDCDYELENTSGQGLVVKWFFKEITSDAPPDVVYQWIQGYNPSATEPVGKYIDLTYKASNNPYTKYRAMKLNNPGIDLSGDYTCVISTFEDERAANATMIVYATGEAFGFEYVKKTLKNDKDSLEATCIAKGLYPQPTLEILVNNSPYIYKGIPTYFETTMRRDGLYDILSRIELLEEELPGASANLECTLSISKANYSVSQMIVYNSGTATTSATANPQHKMGIQALNNPDNGGGSFIDHALSNLLLLLMHLVPFILFY